MKIPLLKKSVKFYAIPDAVVDALSSCRYEGGK